MDNQNEQAGKDRILKSFAVAGFIAIIIIISWLGIKFVSVLPNALTSLASIADTVYNYKKPEIVAVVNKSTVTNGETVSFSWQVPSQKGTFAISYACMTGVSVEIKDGADIRLLNCDTNYNIGAVSGIDLTVFSERNRYTDIAFTVDFIPTNAPEPTASDTRKVTVINSLIAADTGTTVEVTPPATPSTPASTTTPPTTPTTPAVPPKKYVHVPIYGIPVSDPNGTTDLAARFITLGTFSSSNVFTQSTAINRNSTGGIQFEVKNIGSKTSNPWTYIMTLPNGTMYTSPQQIPLKPNERTVITIGFPMDGVSAGTKSSTVVITVMGDNNLRNNSFTATIVVR